MRVRYIPALIMLVAGAITSILNIVNKVEPVSGLKRLLLILIIFFIFGLIVRAIILKITVKKAKDEEMDVEEIQEQSEGEEDKANT